jgi:hypothetical protein
MHCPLQTEEGAELILDYCSRRLAAERAAQLEHHLSQCADCRQVAQAQMAVWSALDEYEAAAVSPDFDERLWARIEAEEAQPWWRRAWTAVKRGPALGWTEWTGGWKPAVAAAACAAIVLGVFAFQGPTPPPPVTDKKVVAEQKVDLDQIENELEDLELLKQGGIVDSGQNGA